jgi:hypothetical protein
MPLDFRNKLDYLKWYAQIRHIKRRAVDLFEQAIEIARRYNEPLLAIKDDLSNVFQDSAGTLPATVGSPIGRITDLTGLGNNATQSTAGNRPVLAQYNGHPSASFNGTTNSMQFAVNPIGPNLSQPYTIIVAGVVGALGSLRRVVGDGAIAFGFDASNRPISTHFGAGNTAAGDSIPPGTPFVAEVVWGGANLQIRINGVVRVDSSISAPTAVGARNFQIGQSGVATSFFNGQLTAVTAFDRVLSDSERTTIGKAFARELGVTYLG